MSTIHVDGNLSLSDKAQFAAIDLTAAHIGGDVDLSSSTVKGTLSMNGMQVDRGLFMREKAQFAEIDLTAVHVGGQLDLNSSTVMGKLAAGYATVEQAMFLGDGAVFADKIDLISANLGQDFDLSNGTFKANVDLTRSQIKGFLGLQSAQWLGSAILDLTDATTGSIDLSHNWPDNIRLNGLTYRILYYVSRPQAETCLGKQAYAPQPYQQLASVLQSNGSVADATEIRYAGKEAERQWASGWNWAWLVLLNYSIGFGYHLEFAFYWALGFVLLGWLVLYVTGERNKHEIKLGLAYSFDMLLPLVQLRKKHYDIDLAPRAQRYFYVHKIIGVILTSFIVAGISGLTK